MKVSYALLAFLCICISPLLQSVQAEPMATLIYIGADCGSGGEVEFELNGDPALYTYYWEHGPTELHLTGLAAGFYTLHVIDFYGCEEIFEIEIISLNDCKVDAVITPGFKKCTFDVQIEVSDPNTPGSPPYDLDLFIIEWDDDPEAGFFRTVRQYDVAFDYHYTVYAIGSGGEICCYEENILTIFGDPEACSISDQRLSSVIINEANGQNENNGQFVELLVLGDSECGGLMDLRGYILDDNNGRLIPSGNLIASANSHLIGIDPGYLIFQYHDNWKEVPNGSLILIYQDHSGNSSAFPVDDPEDSNGDGVYVLAADNSTFLFSQSGQWNSQTGRLDYGGSFLSPNWDVVNINSPADGLQVRDAEGLLSHGISFGKSSYAGNETFELHLHEGDPTSANFQFTQTDYWNKDHFNYYYNEEAPDSPGLPNSVENQALVYQLINCDTPTVSFIAITNTNALAGKDREAIVNTLSVFPNPFKTTFSLAYNSNQAGIAKLEIFNVDAGLIQQNDYDSAFGENRYEVTALEVLPAGVYMLRFTFPDGEVYQQRIVNIRK